MHAWSMKPNKKTYTFFNIVIIRWPPKAVQPLTLRVAMQVSRTPVPLLEPGRSGCI